MQLAFAGAVRVGTVQQHGGRSGQSEARHQKSHLRDAPSSGLQVDGWREEIVSIAAGEKAEEEHPDRPHLWREQRLKHAGLVTEMRFFTVRFELVLSQAFSSMVSQSAWCGLSGSSFKITRLNRTAGSPSTRNNHCQPARPSFRQGPATILPANPSPQSREAWRHKSGRRRERASVPGTKA